MTNGVTVNSWAATSEGCPVNCTVRDTSGVSLLFGDPPGDFELFVDADTLRTVVRLGTDAISEIDATLAREPDPTGKALLGTPGEDIADDAEGP